MCGETLILLRWIRSKTMDIRGKKLVLPAVVVLTSSDPTNFALNQR